MIQLDGGFSTSAMSAAMSPTAFVDAMVRVEVALAEIQAEHGLIEPTAARAISIACIGGFDADEILAQAWRAGTVVVPLLDAIKVRLDPADWPSLHLGATTQDIVDTALMLQLHVGLGLLLEDVRAGASTLVELAERYRHVPSMGRTFLQPAIATTMGARFARWLDGFAASFATLTSARDSLPVQLGGPVGDRSTLGPHPQRLADDLAKRLHLQSSPIAWHSDRSVIADAAAAVAQAVSRCATIGNAVAILAQPEIGELIPRSAGSSSMAHKQNPVDSMRIAACAEANAAAVSALQRPAAQELERGFGTWHAERITVPLMMCTAAGALDATRGCLTGLRLAPIPPAIVLHADVLRASDDLIDHVLDRLPF